MPNRVYSFEQTLDLAGITANQRSVVFRMRDNHLLVYNPVAPTKEFLAQLDGLQSKGVAHILLGATQYEHKVFVAPFARRFPEAKVWAVPDQWSFPLDLPSPLLGIDEKRQRRRRAHRHPAGDVVALHHVQRAVQRGVRARARPHRRV